MTNSFVILLSFQLLFMIETGISFSSSIEQATKIQIELFEKAIIEYKNDIGIFPSTDEGLCILHYNIKHNKNWKGPYINKELPLDYWNNTYTYIYPSIYGNKKFDIYSFGKNKTNDFGRKDDIANWDNTKHQGLCNKLYLVLTIIGWVCIKFFLSIWVIIGVPPKAIISRYPYGKLIAGVFSLKKLSTMDITSDDFKSIKKYIFRLRLWCCFNVLSICVLCFASYFIVNDKLLTLNNLAEKAETNNW